MLTLTRYASHDAFPMWTPYDPADDSHSPDSCWDITIDSGAQASCVGPELLDHLAPAPASPPGLAVIAVGGVKQHIQRFGYIRIFVSPDPKRVQHLALALLATFGIYIPGAPDAPQPSGDRVVTLPTVLQVANLRVTNALPTGGADLDLSPTGDPTYATDTDLWLGPLAPTSPACAVPPPTVTLALTPCKPDGAR